MEETSQSSPTDGLGKDCFWVALWNVGSADIVEIGNTVAD